MSSLPVKNISWEILTDEIDPIYCVYTDKQRSVSWWSWGGWR
jgi:hypothetical protein